MRRPAKVLQKTAMGLFKEIQRDPDVCSNCFRRTHDRFENNFKVSQSHGELYIDPVDGYDDSVYRYDDQTDRIPERGAYRGMTTVCNCGFRYEPDTEWKNRPATKTDLLEYAGRLADRFEESGAGFEREEMLDEVYRLKSDPDEQFRDDDILERAFRHASAIHRIRDTRTIRRTDQ